MTVASSSTAILHHNLWGILYMLLYIQSIVYICNIFVQRRILSMLVSRKIIHIAATCNCIWWIYFDTNHSSWQYCNVMVPAIYGCQLFIKGYILANPNDVDVQTMSRTGKPSELLLGPLFFVLVYVYVGLYEYRTTTGIYILSAMGFGDGIAPIIGYYMPMNSYYSMPYFRHYRKTITGSIIGVGGGTILGVYLLRTILGIPQIWSTMEILTLAVITMIVEAISGPYDNIAIAMSVWIWRNLCFKDDV